MPTLTYQLVKGKPTIRLAYRTERGVTVISTKRQINPDHFNAEAKSENWVRPSYGNGAFEFNQFLKAFRNKHQAIIDAFWTKHSKWPTTAEFKDLADPVKNDKSFFTLYAAWQKHQATGRGANNVSAGMDVNYSKTLKVIERYAAAANISFDLNHINYDFYDAFVVHMSEVENKGKGYTNTTMDGHIKTIRQFLRWCNKKHGTAIPDDIIDEMRGLDEHNAYPFPSLEQVDHLLKMDYRYNTMFQRVRDAFVLQCCLGCRYSDLEKMIVQNIVFENGTYFIRMKTKKNHQLINIPLSVRAVPILERYKNINVKDWIPRSTELNENIKLICKDAGFTEEWVIERGKNEHRKVEIVPIWKKMSSHSARRHFINTMLSLGVPRADVAGMAGMSLLTLPRYEQTNTRGAITAMAKYDASAVKPKEDNAEPQEPKQG